jgi:hypothetical protein
VVAVRCDLAVTAGTHARSNSKVGMCMVSNGRSRAREYAYPWYSPATPRCDRCLAAASLTCALPMSFG